MRHMAACIAVLALALLCLLTISVNVQSRQVGYRIGEALTEADNLRQVIASHQDGCRRLLRMDDIAQYVKALDLKESDLLPPVQADDDWKALARAGRN